VSGTGVADKFPSMTLELPFGGLTMNRTWEYAFSSSA
jgi:hypothetical protein